jgi:hypothetical protein
MAARPFPAALRAFAAADVDVCFAGYVDDHKILGPVRSVTNDSRTIGPISGLRTAA